MTKRTKPRRERETERESKKIQLPPTKLRLGGQKVEQVVGPLKGTEI